MKQLFIILFVFFQSCTIYNKKNDIVYKMPEKMYIDHQYTIKVKINKDHNNVEIISGDNGITIYNDKIILNTIPDILTMSTILISDTSKFDVKIRASKYQKINYSFYNEWEWQIIPINSGKKYIKINIWAIDINKNMIKIYDKKVKIQTKY